MIYLVQMIMLSLGAHGLTLDQCFQSALEKNESYKKQAEVVYQADETVKQSWGSISPQVALQSQWKWIAPPDNTPPGVTFYQPFTRINVSQPVLQGFGEFKGLEKNRSTFRQQEAIREDIRRTTYQSVVAGFHNILSLERDLVDLDEEIKYLVDRIKELERRHEIGRSQVSEVLTARTNVAALKVKVEQDKIALAKARSDFQLLTGVDRNEKLQDDIGDFKPNLKPYEFYIGRISERPDVRATKEEYSAAHEGVMVAYASHLPTLALVYDYYFLNTPSLKGSDWDASILLTVPLFAGGVTQSKVRQAYSVERQATLDSSLAERNATKEIKELYDAVYSDLKQRELIDENVRLSDMTFKEQQKNYRLGLVTNLDVLSALTNYIEAKRSFDQNRYATRSDFLQLESAAAMNNN